TDALVTVPYSPNSADRSSEVAVKDRFPTYNFLLTKSPLLRPEARPPEKNYLPDRQHVGEDRRANPVGAYGPLSGGNTVERSREVAREKGLRATKPGRVGMGAAIAFGVSGGHLARPAKNYTPGNAGNPRN